MNRKNLKIRVQSPGKPEKIIGKKKKSNTSLAQSILKEEIKELQDQLGWTKQPEKVKDVIVHKKAQLKILMGGVQ